MGTENCYVRQMIMFLRSLGNEHNTETCYLEGSSTHNQRIEHWWGFLRRHNAQYWMDMFGMLASIGCYTGNFVDKAILQFCFMNLIQVWVNHFYNEMNLDNLFEIKAACLQMRQNISIKSNLIKINKNFSICKKIQVIFYMFCAIND
jgi:hypothetical protein